MKYQLGDEPETASRLRGNVSNFVNRNSSLLFFILFLAAGARDAHAYIDPGSGSLLYQMLFVIFSIVVGALAVLRTKVEIALGRLSSFVKRLFS